MNAPNENATSSAWIRRSRRQAPDRRLDDLELAGLDREVVEEDRVENDPADRQQAVGGAVERRRRRGPERHAVDEDRHGQRGDQPGERREVRAPLEDAERARAAGRSAAPRRRCSATGCRAGRKPESRARHVRGRHRLRTVTAAIIIWTRDIDTASDELSTSRISRHRPPGGGCPESVFDYIDGGADARAHAARELPRLRRHHLPAALRGGDPGATTCGRPSSAPRSRCRSSSRRSAAAACSGRAAKRSRPRVAGIAGTIYIALDAVGLPAGRREEVDAGPGLVSSSISCGGRDVAQRGDRARARTRATPRWSSPSTRPSPACASATCATA